MARSRADLSEMLSVVVPLLPGQDVFAYEQQFPGGNLRVYFQPPSKMEYPCARYERDESWVSRADNLPYFTAKRYLVTVIDRNPDSVIPDLVEALPWCKFMRFYAKDGLNHWVFNLYF